MTFSIKTLYSIGGCLDIVFRIKIPGTGAEASLKCFSNRSIFWQFLVYSFVPRPIILTNIAMFQVFLMYFHQMHIWMVSVCSNHGPIPFLYFGRLYLNAIFMAWKYDMLVKIQCLFLEVRILWYVWKIMTLWSIPYVYGVNDWVVFWCTIKLSGNIYLHDQTPL